MARVFPVVFVALSVLHAAWGSAIHVADGCTARSLSIIGGENATIEQVPAAVSISVQVDNDFAFICGGVIVHDSFILTAAMCVNETNVQSLTVRVGSSYLHRGGEYADVEKIIVHKHYETKNITDNLALLKLKKPILFGFLAKAKLPTKDFEVEEGTEAIASGWGATNVNESRSEVIHKVIIPIKAQKCCINPDDSILNDVNKICAGSSGLNACQGDGGSPLTQNGVLIGINSYGYNDECDKLPGIYTNIVKYLDWINSTIAENIF